MDRNAEARDVGEAGGVVRATVDRLAEVLADLGRVDVERAGELDVADVVAPKPGVHQPRDERVLGRVPVEVHALHERRGAVADTDDPHPDLLAHDRLRIVFYARR